MVLKVFGILCAEHPRRQVAAPVRFVSLPPGIAPGPWYVCPMVSRMAASTSGCFIELTRDSFRRAIKRRAHFQVRIGFGPARTGCRRWPVPAYRSAGKSLTACAMADCSCAFLSARRASTASHVLATMPSTSTTNTEATPATSALFLRANFCNWYSCWPGAR